MLCSKFKLLGNLGVQGHVNLPLLVPVVQLGRLLYQEPMPMVGVLIPWQPSAQGLSKSSQVVDRDC